LAVIGGGDSAAEEALFLTKYGSKVFVLVRKDYLRASSIMAKRLTSHPKVEILYNTTAVLAKGDGRLMNQLVIDTKGEQKTLDVNGLFYAIGHEPATSLVKGVVDMDAEGYIITKAGTSYTNIKGVFAAGGLTSPFNCANGRRTRQTISSSHHFCWEWLYCCLYM
jgi:thioredoxin reductase (NADPH)